MDKKIKIIVEIGIDTVKLEVLENETIRNLMDKLLKLAPIQLKGKKIDLYFNDRKLDLNNKISDYNIKDKSRLKIKEIKKENQKDGLEIRKECRVIEEAKITRIKLNDEDCSTKKYINIHFLENKKNKRTKKERKNITGILKLCLLKHIAKEMKENDLKKITSNSLKKIMESLMQNVELSGDSINDVKTILNKKERNNILLYSFFIELQVDIKDIENLINIFDETRKEDFLIFWGILSEYQNYNEIFERDISKVLKDSYFDYSIIGAAIVERDEKDKKEFDEAKNNCPNCIPSFLFHGSQVDPIASISNTEFKYTRKAFYGMGIYFTDMMDYVGFYAGGTNINDRREDFGNIPSVNKTFSCIGAHVFYDKNKFKKIRNFDLLVSELDTWPTYDELVNKYKDQMVALNGIHFAQIESECGRVIKTDEYIQIAKQNKKFIGNEFVITEKCQMSPLYCLTIVRQEYYIIWRDPNFKQNNEYSDFLNQLKIFTYQEANANIYFEDTNEGALSIIQRKIHNKPIIITSVSMDLSGKRFVEVARKILGSNVIVLFLSGNPKYLKWIQQFPNTLYTNSNAFYRKYITNYNEQGLKQLKEESEKTYKIKLKDYTDEIIKYPFFKDKGKYVDTEFPYNTEYYRHVLIYSKSSNSYIGIQNNKIILTKDKDYVWDSTLLNGEITLRCKEFYLGFKNGVIPDKLMNLWKYSKVDNSYIIQKPDSSEYLSVRDGNVTLSKNSSQVYDKFELIDVYE